MAKFFEAVWRTKEKKGKGEIKEGGREGKKSLDVFPTPSQMNDDTVSPG